MAPLKKWKSCEHTHDLINTNHTMSHSLCRYHLPRPKMVTNSLEIKVHAANEKAQHALMRGPVFFFLGRDKGIFLLISLFPMWYHHVPQVPNSFLKTFPIWPQIYSIWCAQSSILMYINWKGELYGAHLFLFCDWGPKSCFNWGVHNVAKKLIMYVSFKTKKMLWVHPMFPSSYFLFSCSTWKSFYN